MIMSHLHEGGRGLKSKFLCPIFLCPIQGREGGGKRWIGKWIIICDFFFLKAYLKRIEKPLVKFSHFLIFCFRCLQTNSFWHLPLMDREIHHSSPNVLCCRRSCEDGSWWCHLLESLGCLEVGWTSWQSKDLDRLRTWLLCTDTHHPPDTQEIRELSPDMLALSNYKLED